MDDLRERVEAVERALTDGDGDLAALAEGAATAERVESLAADVEALGEDVAELEAATQALRGYVGSVRSVNESVEQRADAAVAAVETLEERVEALEADGPPSGVGERARDSMPESSGARSEPDGHRTTTGRRDTAGRGDEPCRACGRSGVGDGAAADGGREPRDANRTDPPADSATVDGRGRNREGVDGFDPAERGTRVRVQRREAGERSRDRPDGEGQPERGNGREPGFVRRVRELL